MTDFDRADLNAHPGDAGLFRTALAGPGGTLADAFSRLECAPQLAHVTRHRKRDLLGARMTLAPHEGEGHWELTRIRQDIYVIVENFAYKAPRVELVPGDGLMQFNFRVSGDLTLAVSRSRPLRFNRPSLLLWAQPKGVNVREWTAPSAYERNVAISIRPEFLCESMLNGAEVPEPLRVFARAGNAESVHYRQVPLSAQMFEAVMRLINNPFGHSMGLVYAEAVVMELLCCAVAAFGSYAPAQKEELTDRELRCLHAARAILMKQFAPVPTSRQLARAVGLAETTLRRGFKAVFDETIFDFGLRCRMQHALTLLRDERCSVAQAAEAVGYSYPTSFTAAFRRHFGLRPVDMRRVKTR